MTLSRQETERGLVARSVHGGELWVEPIALYVEELAGQFVEAGDPLEFAMMFNRRFPAERLHPNYPEARFNAKMLRAGKMGCEVAAWVFGEWSRQRHGEFRQMFVLKKGTGTTHVWGVGGMEAEPSLDGLEEVIWNQVEGGETRVFHLAETGFARVEDDELVNMLRLTRRFGEGAGRLYEVLVSGKEMMERCLEDRLARQQGYGD